MLLKSDIEREAQRFRSLVTSPELKSKRPTDQNRAFEICQKMKTLVGYIMLFTSNFISIRVFNPKFYFFNSEFLLSQK